MSWRILQLTLTFFSKIQTNLSAWQHGSANSFNAFWKIQRAKDQTTVLWTRLQKRKECIEELSFVILELFAKSGCKFVTCIGTWFDSDFFTGSKSCLKKMTKKKQIILYRMFKLTKWRWHNLLMIILKGGNGVSSFISLNNFPHHRPEIPCLVPVEKHFLLAIWWILASLVKVDQNWPYFLYFLWTLTLFWCTKMQIKRTRPIISILTTCLQVNASCSTVKTRD